MTVTQSYCPVELLRRTIPATLDHLLLLCNLATDIASPC
jgi:hypothetical protein